MAGPAPVRCPNCGKANRIPSAASGGPHCGNCGATLPWLTEAGESDFPRVAEQSSLPVLVDFWAPWCGPCRMVSPALEQIANERAGRLKLVKVNTDDSPALSQRFGIRVSRRWSCWPTGRRSPAASELSRRRRFALGSTVSFRRSGGNGFITLVRSGRTLP